MAPKSTRKVHSGINYRLPALGPQSNAFDWSRASPSFSTLDQLPGRCKYIGPPSHDEAEIYGGFSGPDVFAFLDNGNVFFKAFGRRTSCGWYGSALDSVKSSKTQRIKPLVVCKCNGCSLNGSTNGFFSTTSSNPTDFHLPIKKRF